jgi:hypothetical protein
MVSEVRIGYDPAVEINSEKHDAWERVIDKYQALSIGHEEKRLEGSSTLFFREDLDLETLRKELLPIRILDSS